MNISPRWRKLLGDLNAAPGRIALMAAALATGMFALVTIATAYGILNREIALNYLDTAPASALIDVGVVTPEILNLVAADPEIAAVEPASIIEAQVGSADGTSQRALLFVVPDIERSAIGTVSPQAGVFPPPEGEIALEREALTFLDLAIGDRLMLRLPGNEPVSIAVAGTVFDASLAPAWQEQTAYAYLSPQTLQRIGGGDSLELLKVVVRDATFDQARTDKVVADLALRLKSSGIDVHQIQIPPAGQHPHQSQMTSVLGMFLVFAALALVLSAVLTATMVTGLLALQVRQIAIMKAIGGTTRQVATLYLAGLAIVAGVATAIAIPLGLVSGASFASIIAQLLNFDIGSPNAPAWLIVGLAALGIALPLGFVAIPIRRATNATVREALADQGLTQDSASGGVLQRLLTRLPAIDRTLSLALRNAFRKRGRLLLNLGLLGAAGAMFISALDVESAWQGQIRAAAELRDYDLEIELARPVAIERFTSALAGVPGVAATTPADSISAAVGRADGLTITRTYPDGGHGSLSLRPYEVLPPNAVFLQGGDGAGGVVLNQQAWSLMGRPALGSRILLVVEGQTAPFELSGVVRQILIPATAYIPQTGFATASRRDGDITVMRLGAVATGPGETAALTDRVEAALAAAGLDVERITTEQTLASAQAGHVQILIVALVAMAVIMATVGAIGLASSQGSSVTERIREFGIMRTVGASAEALMRNILAEGVLIAVLSLPFALAVGLPLGYGIGVLVGSLSFGLPLPLTISMPAIGIWIGILIAGSIVASLAPARRAVRLTIRQTLAHV